MIKQNKSHSPIYIPRVQDSHVATCDSVFPMIIMDAQHITWRNKTAQKIRSVTKQLVIDPATDKLLYKGSSQGVNIQKLGYPSNIEVTKLFGAPKLRRSVLENCVKDQLEKGADLLIAPYFYAKDPDALGFNLNLTMLSETVQYLKDRKISKPLFAYIKVDKVVLNRLTVVNMIVDRYREYSQLSGYFVTINELDCRKEDEDTLTSLVSLVQQLSQQGKVFMSFVDGFGEVLCALGAAGYSSGPATGEVFSVANFEMLTENRKFKKQEKTFIPELSGYLNDEAVKKIKYKCDCSVCDGAVPRSAAAKKKHFMMTKFALMQKISNLPEHVRIPFMIERLNGCLAYSTQLRNSGVDTKSPHLKRWLNVLKTISHTDAPASDNEFEKFLTSLEKK